MSDHFDYGIRCTFPHSLSGQVVDTLTYMTRSEDYAFHDCPDHPFFAPEEFFEGEVYEAWRGLLQYPRGEDTGHFARFFRFRSPRYQWGPGYGDPYILDFRIDVHEDNEGYYWGLLDWLATVSSSRGFVDYSILKDGGFSQPTLFYFIDGRLRRHQVSAAEGAPDIGISFPPRFEGTAHLVAEVDIPQASGDLHLDEMPHEYLRSGDGRAAEREGIRHSSAE